jgi:hypothetical protein
VRRLHGLQPPGTPALPAGWDAYRVFLQEQARTCRQRHTEWGTLPSHLLEQIENYLLPPEDLFFPGEQPHLIHADLTVDHLLGSWQNGRWAPRALIDFGDAMVGSLYYELAALHLDLFNADPTLLHVFLDNCGLPAARDPGFARKALSTALLHRFNLFVPGKVPLGDTWEAVAAAAWENPDG